ncbi:hypothetical protein C0X77_003573 [Escherichia coli O88:H1]|nr:hypothetical protein [Escherichia coli O88:H1]
MGYIKKKSKKGTSGSGNGNIPLEEKPFNQWTDEDLKEWTERCWLEYLDLLNNDEMDETELLDYTNCWRWEVIGDALVFKRIAEPDESYLRSRYAPGKFNEYDVVGYCRVHEFYSLSYRPAAADQARHQQRKYELQKQLNAGLPNQGVQTVPRPRT